jgi:hypothetical protein
MPCCGVFYANPRSLVEATVIAAAVALRGVIPALESSVGIVVLVESTVLGQSA